VPFSTDVLSFALFSSWNSFPVLIPKESVLGGVESHYTSHLAVPSFVVRNSGVFFVYFPLADQLRLVPILAFPSRGLPFGVY